MRYEIKSRHLSRRPKVLYKTRNLTECTDRAQTDIGIHVHSYEEKVNREVLLSLISRGQVEFKALRDKRNLESQKGLLSSNSDHD